MTPEVLTVGAPAPQLSLRTKLDRYGAESFGGEPIVVAFLDDVETCDPGPDDLQQLRKQLRGLGAALLVLAKDGLFLYRPDDDVERVARGADLDASDVRRTRTAFGVGGKPSRPGLFVVDENGTLVFAHVWRDGTHVGWNAVVTALASAGAAKNASRRSVLLSRREVVLSSLVAGFVALLLDGCKSDSSAGAADAGSATAVPNDEIELTLNVNGAPHAVKVDPASTLLDTLRERMSLPGTKKGCDHGQCGACTVHVDGRRMNSCLLLAQAMVGKNIVTIEGLSNGADLHPMQKAFVEEDALQCGYCTPGQIMSAVALLREGGVTTDDQIREGMSGNICRCGAYPNIVTAIQRVRTGGV